MAILAKRVYSNRYKATPTQGVIKMMFFIQVLATVYPVMAESLAQAQHGIEATTGVAPADQHPLFNGAAFTIEGALETGFLG